MGELVDVDDLLVAPEVAALLGLSSYRTVSVYAARHEDFPRPVIEKSNGRVKLWLRSDIENWNRARRRGDASR